MKALDLRRDAKAAITLDIRYPLAIDAEHSHRGDGDIVSVQEEQQGRLPERDPALWPAVDGGRAGRGPLHARGDT